MQLEYCNDKENQVGILTIIMESEAAVDEKGEELTAVSSSFGFLEINERSTEYLQNLTSIVNRSIFMPRFIDWCPDQKKGWCVSIKWIAGVYSYSKKIRKTLNKKRRIRKEKANNYCEKK